MGACFQTFSVCVLTSALIKQLLFLAFISTFRSRSTRARLEARMCSSCMNKINNGSISKLVTSHQSSANASVTLAFLFYCRGWFTWCVRSLQLDDRRKQQAISSFLVAATTTWGTTCSSGGGLMDLLPESIIVYRCALQQWGGNSEVRPTGNTLVKMLLLALPADVSDFSF